MKITRLVIGFFALLLLLPLSVAAQNIGVDPATWDYGQVDLGDSAPMSFTIESLGPDTPLRVDMIMIIDDNSGSFDITLITPEITFPYYLPVGETMEVVVDFEPSDEGLVTASLHVISNAHNGAFLDIPLQGEGIDNEPAPDELMEKLIDFFDAGATSDVICGLGKGNSTMTHLRVFASMLDSAEDLIELGDYVAACDQLEHAFRKSDGESPPPDFIGCDGAPVVNAMIGEVMDVLGCE